MGCIRLYIDYRHILSIYGSEMANFSCEAGRQNGRFRAQVHRIELQFRGEMRKFTAL